MNHPDVTRLYIGGGFAEALFGKTGLEDIQQEVLTIIGETRGMRLLADIELVLAPKNAGTHGAAMLAVDKRLIHPEPKDE